MMDNSSCTCSSDRWHDEDIMIHEFAHGVHLLGAKYAIQGWQARLQSLYRSARYSGKWANTYAMSTQDEYFVSVYTCLACWCNY